MGQQEEQEYCGLKDENGAAFLMMIVFVVPGPEEQLRAVVRERAESAPVFEDGQSAGVEHDEIRKERSILIAIGVQQHGGQQSANQRHDSDRGSVVDESERGAFGNQNREESKRGLLSDKMVVAKSCVGGK